LEESKSGDTLRELVEARRRPAAEADAERRPREVRRCIVEEESPGPGRSQGRKKNKRKKERNATTARRQSLFVAVETV